ARDALARRTSRGHRLAANGSALREAAPGGPGDLADRRIAGRRRGLRAPPPHAPRYAPALGFAPGRALGRDLVRFAVGAGARSFGDRAGCALGGGPHAASLV